MGATMSSAASHSGDAAPAASHSGDTAAAASSSSAAPAAASHSGDATAAAASSSAAAAAASHSGDATAAASSSSSSSSAAPAARYYFCHICFLATALAPGTACPLCNGPSVEEINIPPSEAPRPHPNLGLYFTTGCLSTSPASFALRSHAEADDFFRSPLSPLRHLRLLPTERLPYPLAILEEYIAYLLATGNSAAPVYVVLAGVLPPHYTAPSNREIARLADQINANGRLRDTFITLAARQAVAALRDVEIDDAGPQGGEQPCAVCQETLAIGTAAASFSCAHVFHRNCILQWLQQQHTCPVCRFSPLTKEMIGPSHSVFRVVIPPPSLALDLDENIVIRGEKVRGCPEILPHRWA